MIDLASKIAMDLNLFSGECVCVKHKTICLAHDEIAFAIRTYGRIIARQFKKGGFMKKPVKKEVKKTILKKKKK